MALKDQEERLKFLVSKVDSEIAKFERLLENAKSKRSELEEEVRAQGLRVVPVSVIPHSDDKESLEEELAKHLLDLNKLKNLINSKLEVVIKEEELIESLKKKYGQKVGLKKKGPSDFEITYKDADSEAAYDQVGASRKTISRLKESVDEILGKE